jgi:hypothetical protein
MNLTDPRSQVCVAIAAKQSVVSIETDEELRVLTAMLQVAEKMKGADSEAMDLVTWSVNSGFRLIGDDKKNPKYPLTGQSITAPGAALSAIRSTQLRNRTIFVLLDFHPFLEGTNPAFVQPIRALKELGQDLKNRPPKQAAIVVMLSGTRVIPNELKTDIVCVDWPLPDDKQLSAIVTDVYESVKKDVRDRIDADIEKEPRLLELVTQAARGMTGDEAENCIARSLAAHNTFNIAAVAEGKRAAVKRAGSISWVDELMPMSDLAGLEGLKAWIYQRKLGFSPEAREYGLPIPRGIALIGPPGTGKTAATLAIANALECPLLDMSAGDFMDKYIGEPVKKIRRGFAVAEAAGQCVLRVDEFEKVFVGMGGDGASDGGAKKEVGGEFLKFLSTKTKPVFVALTMNSTIGIPPEMFRSGRLDAMFGVDLPHPGERKGILEVHIRKRGRKPENYALAELVEKSGNFSGAELENAVESAMFSAFADGSREFTTADLAAAIGRINPIAESMEAELKDLRSWCKTHTRPASIEHTNVDDGSDGNNRFANM